MRMLTGIALVAVLAAGCSGGDSSSAEEAAPPSQTSEEFGAYPADTSLDQEEVVEAYALALTERDGERFCRLVAPWISGRFDIAGTDPDEESLSRPLRCPEVVAALIDFPWENQEQKLESASVDELGDVEGDETLTSVPVTFELRLENDNGVVTEERLEDVVWLTKDVGAWRIAKLGMLAAWATLVQVERDELDELRMPPNVEDERAKFAAEVANALRVRATREAEYRAVYDSASCADGTTYPDVEGDVVDYRHPAPASPTPQLPAADIRALHVHAGDGVICALFELQGDVQTGTTFDFAIESPDSDWGLAGFSQGFEVELRADDRARVTSGQSDERRPLVVPAEVGREGNRLMIRVDAQSFSAGNPFPGSRAASRVLTQFRLRADVTLEVSAARLLHDDLDAPEDTGRLRYP